MSALGFHRAAGCNGFEGSIILLWSVFCFLIHTGTLILTIAFQRSSIVSCKVCEDFALVPPYTLHLVVEGQCAASQPPLSA